MRRFARIIVTIVLVVVLLVSPVLDAHAYAVGVAALGLDVAITLLVILVMGTIGVTITGSSSGSAADWLLPRLLSYVQGLGYSSLGQWLGVSAVSALGSVIGGLVMLPSGIANKVISAVNVLTSDLGVSSGGASVGDLGLSSVSSSYNLAYSWDGSSVSIMSGSTVYGPNSNTSKNIAVGVWFDLSFLTGTSLTISVGGNGSYFYGTSSASSNDYLMYNLAYAFSNTVFSEWTESNVVGYISRGSSRTFSQQQIGSYRYLYIGAPWTSSSTRYHYVRFAQGYNITVTGLSRGTDGSCVITPSASVTAPTADLALGQSLQIAVSGVEDGMTISEALQHVDELTTTSAGLSGSAETVGDAVPAGSEWLYNAITGVQDAVESIGGSEYDGFDPVQGLESVFPFCLPFDVYRALCILSSDPVAPSVTWSWPVPESISASGSLSLSVDLSPFDSVAAIFRRMQLLGLVIGLCLESKRWIKGGNG